jgi:hypothetical protein
MKTKLILSLLLSFCAAFVVTTLAGVPELTLPFVLITSLAMGSLPKGLAFDSLISGTPITFNGKEATSGIILPAFSRPELSLFHTVLPGIVSKMQVAYLSRITKITLLDAGCGTGLTSKSLSMTQLFWDPKPLKIWIGQCASDLEQTYFTYGLKKGKDRKDLGDTDFEDYILEILPEGIQDDAFRLSWFGDEDADTNANGGQLLNASDVDHYNQLDGFWKKIFAAVTGLTMRRVTIAENAEAAFVDQLDLAADAAYKIFKAMATGTTDSRLKTEKGKFILCTSTLWENWLAYKESQSFDRSFERQEKGYQSDVFRGIPIYSVDAWDRYIQGDFQDGTAYYLPHRAIMTTAANLQIGLDTDNVEALNYWFEKKDEKHYFRGGYKMDVQIPHDFMMVAAY